MRVLSSEWARASGWCLTPETSSVPRQIVSLLERNPLILARILDRDLPVELIDMCKDVGLPLLPSQWYALRTRCSCPDDAPGKGARPKRCRGWRSHAVWVSLPDWMQVACASI